MGNTGRANGLVSSDTPNISLGSFGNPNQPGFSGSAQLSASAGLVAGQQLGRGQLPDVDVGLRAAIGVGPFGASTSTTVNPSEVSFASVSALRESVNVGSVPAECRIVR